MNGVRRKSRQVDGEVLSAFGARSAVAYPLAGADDERLPRQKFVSCVTGGLDLQFTTPHNRVFVEPRRLPRLAPTRRARQLGDFSADVWEFTRPINSSMIFGGSPAAGITATERITRAMLKTVKSGY